MVLLKTLAEIEMMAEAGHIVALVFERMGKIIAPGISTLDLDQEARTIISHAGAAPSFLGYGQPPFPGAICASVDAEVVHGIPDRQQILKEGSLVSIDVGACLNGYHADAARTYAVGKIKPAVADLIRVTEECFWKGFAKARAGARLGDISAAVQQHAEAHGYGVVRELTGHGIGRSLHENPDLPNFGRPGHGMRLDPGLVVALEPMINMGTRRVYIQEDEWTIVTADGQPSAHYENTLAILADGPVILTRLK